MQLHYLYDQGSARIPEDGLVFYPPHWFGALDGISGIYLPDEGPRRFDGRTGGQFAVKTLSDAFSGAMPKKNVEDVLMEAAKEICKEVKTCGLSIEQSELLPSAAFAVAKITPFEVTILQGGDSLAVWELKNGTRGGTKNKTFAYEKFLLDTVATLMAKHQGNRTEMWREFRPILAQRRRDNVNKPRGGFSLLNGQPEFVNFWQKFTFKPEDLSLLILFSDGLVPFDWTADEKQLARHVIGCYRIGGLEEVLKATRKAAEQKKSASHEDFAEATAIAMEF